LDYFVINSSDELPKINEVLMEELVKATIINPSTDIEDEDNSENVASTSENIEIAEQANSDESIEVKQIDEPTAPEE
jgi:hypothetical protein